MKPQCNTSADCLRELARVMDQFGIKDTIDAANSVYVKFTGCSIHGLKWNETPTFCNPNQWQFAIAEVEGKPVFPYQEGLYAIGGGRFIPASAVPAFKILSDETGYTFSEDELTWNPPRPKTVMVELTVDQAELGAKLGLTTDIAQACKKALEQIK